jgi:hypothetical protein
MVKAVKGGTVSVITNSRFRAWWLTTFKGYEVSSRAVEPKMGPIGQIRYVKHWHLQSISGEED